MKSTLPDLNDYEWTLVYSFAHALSAGRAEITPSQLPANTALLTIVQAGRLSELFDTVRHLADKPPARAPRLWNPEGNEEAAAAILNIYAPWLEKELMHRGMLRKLDRPLYEEFLRHCRHKSQLTEEALENQLRVEDMLPTRQDFNTRLLTKEIPDDPAERARIDNVRRSRKFRRME